MTSVPMCAIQPSAKAWNCSSLSWSLSWANWRSASASRLRAIWLVLR